ncbi:porin [Comamonas testosteroni]|uniref:porin n=1 Tax=Comamonas testosteroni TaxID=285 RepID=UPI0009B9F85D|nr:porin [Comamonas testosteroni]
MKLSKHLIGACLVGGLGPVWGQSSASVFGVLDLGVSHYKVNGGQSQTALSDHGNSSSRIGIRGREDVGGGRAIQYWLEGGIDPSQPGSFAFTRRSTIGLSGAWGEVRLGRDYTPSYNAMSDFGGPWVTNGVGESLLYRARATSHGSSNGGQSTNVRASNAINYFLPKGLGGAYGQLMYGFDEAVEGHAGRYIGARLGYKAKQWDVGMAYNTAAGGTAAPAKTPRDMRNFSLGASYRLSFGKLSALYINDRIEMPGGDKKLTGMSVGMEIPMGQGQVRASFARVKFDHEKDHSQARKIALGYVHDLSKRTALYTTLAFIDNDNGAKFTTGGDVSGIANKSSTGVDFGIRHRF